MGKSDSEPMQKSGREKMSEKSKLKQFERKVGGEDVETISTCMKFGCKGKREMEL